MNIHDLLFLATLACITHVKTSLWCASTFRMVTVFLRYKTHHKRTLLTSTLINSCNSGEAREYFSCISPVIKRLFIRKSRSNLLRKLASWGRTMMVKFSWKMILLFCYDGSRKTEAIFYLWIEAFFVNPDNVTFKVVTMMSNFH